MRAKALLCSGRLPDLSERRSDIAHITQSLLVHHLVIELKSPPWRMTSETVSRQLSLKSMIRPRCPEPFCGYRVPACCHGNAVQDLNTNCASLPVSLLSPPRVSHLSSSSLLTFSHASTSQPSLLWSASHSLPLTLPAK